MKKLVLMGAILSSLFALMYALGYVESSNGLGNPQLEGGRTELEMVDINNDGNIDILSIGDHGSPYVNTQEHGVMVWFGNGQGSWSVYQNGNFGYGGIAIGDINNDGFLDIGYGMHHNYDSTDFGDSILEVALGDGTGQNWTPWDDGISIGDPDYWGMFCTDFADINNDGYLDLGANSFGANDGIHVFRNNGNGTWTQVFGFLGGNSQDDFLFGDINNDANPDFCAAHQNGSIYLGNGGGGFTLADGNLPAPGNSGRSGPSLGDVDNDGDQDFAFTNQNGGIQVWAWQGSNTWANFSGSLPASGPYYGTQLWDMNIDGFMDIAAFGDSTVTVWLGNGAGNWTLTTTFYTPGSGYYAAFRVGGDADHNGYPDIALVGEEGDSWNAINHLRFYKETSVPNTLFVFPVFPRGREKFRSGSVHFIRWTCGVPSGSTATIKLELSTSGPSGPWSTIINSTPNNSRYQWRIPTGISSTNCYIRYTATTSSSTKTAITPFAFTILPAVDINETYPRHLIEQSLEVIPTLSNGKIKIIVTTFGLNNIRARHIVSIFDNFGNLIKRLLEIRGSGKFEFYWDKKDSKDRPVPSGIYFVTLKTNDKQISKKVLVLR